MNKSEKSADTGKLVDQTADDSTGGTGDGFWRKSNEDLVDAIVGFGKSFVDGADHSVKVVRILLCTWYLEYAELVLSGTLGRMVPVETVP